MKNLLHAYNIIMQCLEKFLTTFEKEVFLKNYHLTKDFDSLRSHSRSDFKDSRIFPIFASIPEDESVIWSCFWCCCKELLLGNLLDTYSMTVQYLETFLIDFEKMVSLKKQTIAVVCKPASSEWSKLVVKLEFLSKTSFWKAPRNFSRHYMVLL